MDAFIAAFVLAATPQTTFALIGAAIGAYMSSDKATYGVRLTAALWMMTLACAGVASEILTKAKGYDSLFIHLLLGGIVGIIGLRLLDALRLASEDFTTKLVNLASINVLDLAGLAINKLKSIFGL